MLAKNIILSIAILLENSLSNFLVCATTDNLVRLVVHVDVGAIKDVIMVDNNG